MKTRLTSLEHLVLHDLLLKMAAECEDAGVCCNCDCTHICPFAFSGEGGGLHWEYVNPEDKIQRLSRRSPRVKVKVKCVETGEVFKSLRDGSAKTGASRSSLWRASLPENSHLTAGGYHWTRV